MNILIVDDHPLTVSVYSGIIGEKFSNTPNILSAYNCEEGHIAVSQSAKTAAPIDIAIVDYNLPPYENENIFNGADLAVYLKKLYKDCKVLMITSHTEILIIYDLLRRVNPHGLVSKNDVDANNLIDIIIQVIDGRLYKSPQIKKCINEVWSNDIMVDEYNRKILLYLAKGYKIKELEDVVMLSKSAIQKRILKLRRAFNAKDERGLMKKIFQEKFL